MKLFVIISFVLSSLSVHDIPEYSGAEIDLSTFKIATLYKGKTKEFLIDKQDARDIYKIVSKEKGLWYVTLKFKLTKYTIEEEDIWLQYRTNIYATSIYLNGNLLLRNGQVKNSSASETVGRNLVVGRIPKKILTEGENLIEIEFTNFKYQTNAIFRDVSIGSLEAFQKQKAIMTMAPTLLLGVFFFFMLMNLVLFFSLNKKRVFLLLALLFLINSFIGAYEVLYWNGLVPSASFINSYTIRSGLEYLSYFILLCVLFSEYKFKKRIILLTALTFVMVYIFSFWTNYNIAVVLSSFPFIVSFYGLYHREQNSRAITLSLFLLLILNYLDDSNALDGQAFVKSNFMITSLAYKLDSFGILIFALVMIFISAKGILFKTKSLNEAHVKLERLEYQFLQKLMLPHFMVNTLMSIKYLITKEPETASIMIDALSEEFHLLSEMNKKKLIPISQEIEICHTHLKIISIQQNANYKMEVTGFSGNEMIPPTIFHTLIENGITHGYSGNQNAYFELKKEITETSTRYRLFNDSRLDKVEEAHTSGTGLKYIEARLEECFPGKWQLFSNKTLNGWESIIEIKSEI